MLQLPWSIVSRLLLSSFEGKEFSLWSTTAIGLSFWVSYRVGEAVGLDITSSNWYMPRWKMLFLAEESEWYTLRKRCCFRRNWSTKILYHQFSNLHFCLLFLSSWCNHKRRRQSHRRWGESRARHVSLWLAFSSSEVRIFLSLEALTATHREPFVLMWRSWSKVCYMLRRKSFILTQRRPQQNMWFSLSYQEYWSILAHQVSDAGRRGKLLNLGFPHSDGERGNHNQFWLERTTMLGLSADLRSQNYEGQRSDCLTCAHIVGQNTSINHAILHGRNSGDSCPLPGKQLGDRGPASIFMIILVIPLGGIGKLEWRTYFKADAWGK